MSGFFVTTFCHHPKIGKTRRKTFADSELQNRKSPEKRAWASILSPLFVTTSVFPAVRHRPTECPAGPRNARPASRWRFRKTVKKNTNRSKRRVTEREGRTRRRFWRAKLRFWIKKSRTGVDAGSWGRNNGRCGRFGKNGRCRRYGRCCSKSAQPAATSSGRAGTPFSTPLIAATIGRIVGPSAVSTGVSGATPERAATVRR